MEARAGDCQTTSPLNPSEEWPVDLIEGRVKLDVDLRPIQAAIDHLVEGLALHYGLTFEHSDQYFGLKPVYCMSENHPRAICGAVESMLEFIRREHGEGKFWCLLQPIHVVTDDGDVYGFEFSGRPHLVLRSFICRQ